MIRALKPVTALVLCLLMLKPILAVERSGADKAAPKISEFIDSLSISPESRYTLSVADTQALVALSASLGINVFELMDCSIRHAVPARIRLVIQGEVLRNLEDRYRLGDDRVLSILPIQNLNRLELGKILSPGENTVDIFLNSEYESFIEIGTARYNTRFGFSSVSPLLFDGCYGVQVSRFFFTAPLLKLELYAPAKGAIYVKGIPKPKRWNLNIIAEKKR